jgi:hypothetical protein
MVWYTEEPYKQKDSDSVSKEIHLDYAKIFRFKSKSLNTQISQGSGWKWNSKDERRCEGRGCRGVGDRNGTDLAFLGGSKEDP